MARLLMRHSIVELEKLFSFAKGDPETLQTLEDELKHRNVPRAVALLDKVQRALRAAKPPSKTSETPEPAAKSAASRSAQQGPLWDEEPKPVPKIVMVTTGTEPPKPPVVPVPVEPPAKAPTPTMPASKPIEVMPSMSADEAYRVLKATPGTTWEAIEKTRRQMVQQAHPEKVAGLSSERGAQVQADAKRANAAYAVLIQTRTRDNQG